MQTLLTLLLLPRTPPYLLPRIGRGVWCWLVGTLWYIVGWYIVYIVGWYSLYSWLVWYSVYVAAVPTPEDWKWCILYSVGWLVQFVQFVQLVGTVCILPLYLLPRIV